MQILTRAAFRLASTFSLMQARKPVSVRPAETFLQCTFSRSKNPGGTAPAAVNSIAEEMGSRKRDPVFQCRRIKSRTDGGVE